MFETDAIFLGKQVSQPREIETGRETLSGLLAFYYRHFIYKQ